MEILTSYAKEVRMVGPQMGPTSPTTQKNRWITNKKYTEIA